MEARRWHNSGEKENFPRDRHTADKVRQAKENREDGSGGCVIYGIVGRR